jgi:hypothetical protein
MNVKSLSAEQQAAVSLGFPKPVSIGNGLYACVATISPKAAREILDNHHIANNRNMRSSLVKVYGEDMAVGYWSLTHQPVAFDSRMQMCDGQHRLAACIEYDRPFTSIVIFGVHPESVSKVDSGASRTTVDAGRILGIHVDKSHVAIVKMMAFRNRQRRISKSIEMELLKTFKDPLTFLSGQFPSKIAKVTVSPVMAAIGLAWYHADPERLTQFCVALREGFITDRAADSAAIQLGSVLKTGHMSYGGLMCNECLFKSITAIGHFLNRKPTARIYASDKAREMFPLPKNVARRIAMSCRGDEEVETD